MECSINMLWYRIRVMILEKEEVETSNRGLKKRVTEDETKGIGRADPLESPKGDTHSKVRPWYKSRRPKRSKFPRHNNKSK